MKRIDFDRELKKFGSNLVVTALSEANNHRINAADLLGMHRNTLTRWLEIAESLGYHVPKPEVGRKRA